MESKEDMLRKRKKIYGDRTPIINKITYDKIGSEDGYRKGVIIQGHYAVNDPIDGILKFYRINIPKEGKRVGYIFVSVQASHDYYPIKNRQHREAILKEIAKDPLGCMKRYGKEIGECGVCGRILTDQESRDRGIGPICWSKVGEN